MVEPATLDDIPALVELGRAMTAESPRYSRLEFSASRFSRLLSHLISSPEGLVLVARRDGVLIGGILASCAPSWMSDASICQEIALFILPQYRGGFTATRLISGVVAWSKIRGAAWCEVGVSTGVNVDRTTRLYQKLGFSPVTISLER